MARRGGGHDSAVLAAHFEAGNDLERAAEQYERAATHAREGDDLDVVLSLAERAILCGARGERLGRLRGLKARALSWKGNAKGAVAELESALPDLHRETGPWYDAASLLATLSTASGNPDRATEIALLLDHEMPQPEGVAWIGACSRVVQALLLSDRGPSAQPLLARLESVPPEHLALHPASRGDIAVARAVWRSSEQEPAACAALLREAADAYELVGDTRRALLQRASVAYMYIDLGAYAAMEALGRDVAAAAERAGLTYVELGARYCTGRALMHFERWAEARELLERAASGFTSGGNLRLAGVARIGLADFCLATGDVDGAASEIEQAISALAQSPPYLALALATRARVRLRQDRAAEALVDAREAIAPLESGRSVEGSSRVHLVYSEALRATGAIDASCREIVKAREALLKQASKITDAAWQKSFLEDVADNRRTLALAREWSAAAG